MRILTKKRNTLSIFTLLLSISLHAQLEKELQIRLGGIYGAYLTQMDWQYTFANTVFEESGKDTFGFVGYSIDLRYSITPRLTMGLNFCQGLEQHEQKVPSQNPRNNLGKMGIATEFNIVNRADFRFFAGLHLNYSWLNSYNGVYVGTEIPYDLRTRWRGAGFQINTGIVGFIKNSPIGFHFSLGLDGRQMSLYSITFDEEEQSLDGTKADVSYSGIAVNGGLVFRFRSKA